LVTETRDLTIRDNTQILEKVILQGDLAELAPADRVSYYAKVCDSLGLNPFTRPFDYIKLNNKLTLYARKDATDQLRNIKGVSISIVSREVIDGIYVVTARATCGNRTDESTGAVDVSSLKGDFKANAMMKAETKAKRRVTLSIVGLGWLDETEVSDIPPKDAQQIFVDSETGEIKEPEPVSQDKPDVPGSNDWILSKMAELSISEQGMLEYINQTLHLPIEKTVKDTLEKLTEKQQIKEAHRITIAKTINLKEKQLKQP